MPENKKKTINARAKAVDILVDVLPGATTQKSLTQLMSLQNKEQADAIPPFTQQIVYGVCRYYQPLMGIIKKRLSKPLKPKDRDITITLLVGAYQLLFTQKARHAIIFETTQISKKRGKPWASGLINAILRKIDTEQFDVQSISPAEAFPQWLKALIDKAYGSTERDHIFKHSLIPGPMTLRVNTQTISPEQFKQDLDQADLKFNDSSDLDECITLHEATPVSKIPGFFDGACSVQDEAAQWATHLLSPSLDSKVLDICAAPGGKSCHLLEKFPSIELTAADISDGRLKQLKENLARLSLKALITCFDASDPQQKQIKAQSYDYILLDAPCSGVGVIRRHPDILWLRRSSDLSALVQTQKRILENAWAMLKVGGKLLYCTCSVLPQENQLQVQQFLDNHSDAFLEPIDAPQLISQSCFSQITTAGPGLQLLPTADKHDGFYFALLSKKSNKNPIET